MSTFDFEKNFRKINSTKNNMTHSLTNILIVIQKIFGKFNKKVMYLLYSRFQDLNFTYNFQTEEFLRQTTPPNSQTNTKEKTFLLMIIFFLSFLMVNHVC